MVLSYVLFLTCLQHCIPLPVINAYALLSTPPANLELCIPYLQDKFSEYLQNNLLTVAAAVSWLVLIRIEYFYSYKN